MDKVLNFLFSMRMTVICLFIFFAAIGEATFIESNYGVQAARIIVYNALWFEILLVFMSVNLLANIFTYKMYRKEKIASFLFHVSFLIILLGSAVTRYFSFEGTMRIGEGQESNIIYSADPYLIFKVSDPDNNLTNRVEQKMYMSEITDNSFYMDMDFAKKKKKVRIEYMNFQRNMTEKVITNDTVKQSSLVFTIAGQESLVGEKKVEILGGIPVGFEKTTNQSGLEITREGRTLKLHTYLPINYLDMSQLTAADRQDPSRLDSMKQIVAADSMITLESGKLYSVGNLQFVFKELRAHTGKYVVKADAKGEGVDILTVKIQDGKNVRQVALPGGMKSLPNPVAFEMDGLLYNLTYGPKIIELPFFVGCKDFRLDRYAGSSNPSTFESDLIINDSLRNYKKEHNLFMNHVIDYDGYRFFQSSYFSDLSGTILSVNHDWWGTNITYLGYLLMSIAMIMSIFTPGGRMREINDKLKKFNERKAKTGITILLALISFCSIGQTGHEGHNHDQSEHQEVRSGKPKLDPKATHFVISEEHSEKLARLLVSDSIRARVLPFHTACLNITRKLYRADSYKGLNPVQFVMSMQLYQEYWMQQPVIHVHKVLREKLGITEKKISLDGMVTEEGNYRLFKEFQEAHRKKENDRSEFDKQIIKLYDRVEVFMLIRNWSFMKMIPLTADKGKTWIEPGNSNMTVADTAMARLASDYLISLVKLEKSKNYAEADKYLVQLIKKQREIGKNEVPSESLVEYEILYNKMNIFKNAQNVYMGLGFLLLVIFIFQTVARSSKFLKILKKVKLVFGAILILVFVYHGFGLILRAMITGHAPWSNGYEAIVFIAWITMIAGFIFSKKNGSVLGAAALLAGMMLFVSGLNLLDPQITSLQPVLKSYWLMIHVAIITSSYAFLGLSAILGLVGMLLFKIRSKNNAEFLNININEITYISEMSMTVGVFLLTIGTFLGGIWANESWGRYWGWDPKETWALVSVLVYAMILHFRFIPFLKSKLVFNIASFWGYSAILFTFFGVNFKLTGLHSYAQGEGVAETPMWIYIVVLIFLIYTSISIILTERFKKFNK